MRNKLAVAALLLAACTHRPKAAAHFGACENMVWRALTQGGAPEIAVPRLSLYLGNEARTGPDSHAQILFLSGGIVSLDPDSALVVNGADITLVAGAISIEGDTSIMVNTPLGRALLAPGTKTRLDSDTGLSVIVGEVDLSLPNGTRKRATAGQSMTVDGLTVQVGDMNVPGLNFDVEGAAGQLVTVPIDLYGDPRQVQVRRPGESSWVAIKKHEALVPGSTVRTRSGAGTRLDIGDKAALGSVGFSRAAVFTLGEVAPTRVDYEMKLGTADIHFDKLPGNLTYVVHAEGGDVSVEAGVREASVDVGVREGGRIDVGVKSGRATLPEGVVLEAGTRAVVENGHSSQPAPIADTQVNLAQRASEVFFAGRTPPPLAFTFPKHEGPALVEIAHDQAYAQPVFKDSLLGNRLVVGDLPAGKYHWRVKLGDTWQESTFSVSRGSTDNCSNCKRANLVEDSGEKTVVYFQQLVPDITLHWSPTEGASNYRLKLFADGDFDRPLVNVSARETQFVLQSGHVREGKYYWLVEALDGSGAMLPRQQRMNVLELAFDNAIADIVIKTPLEGAQVQTAQITTSGEVRLGAHLWINSHAAEIDAKGRFVTPVALSKAGNTLVYRVLMSDGTDRYYFRTVYRR